MQFVVYLAIITLLCVFVYVCGGVCVSLCVSAGM